MKNVNKIFIYLMLVSTITSCNKSFSPNISNDSCNFTCTLIDSLTNKQVCNYMIRLYKYDEPASENIVSLIFEKRMDNESVLNVTLEYGLYKLEISNWYHSKVIPIFELNSLNKVLSINMPSPPNDNYLPLQVGYLWLYNEHFEENHSLILTRYSNSTYRIEVISESNKNDSIMYILNYQNEGTTYDPGYSKDSTRAYFSLQWLDTLYILNNTLIGNFLDFKSDNLFFKNPIYNSFQQNIFSDIDSSFIYQVPYSFKIKRSEPIQVNTIEHSVIESSLLIPNSFNYLKENILYASNIGIIQCDHLSSYGSLSQRSVFVVNRRLVSFNSIIVSSIQ